jgi:signal transduction histidine kinase/DNA-binding NarL/FixJ family response regulator
VTHSWKILVLGSCELDLERLCQVFEHSSRVAEFRLARNGSEVAESMATWPCDVLIGTSQVSHMQLAQAMTELHRRDPHLPVVFIVRAGEIATLSGFLASGSAAVVAEETIGVLLPTLEREINRSREFRTQQRRHHRSAWVETALDRAPVPLAVADAKGFLQWANSAYMELLNLTAETIDSGKTSLWHGETDRWNEIHDAFHAGRVWRGTIPAQTGEMPVLHHILIARLARSDGGISYVIVRQPSATSLGSTEAADTMSALQRTEVFAAIAGGIALDLNNILSPIATAAGMLGEQKLSDENSELVRTILQNAERGSAVIRQVLAFANGSENCAMQLQPRWLLREVARLAAEIFSPQVSVRADIPNTLWPIIGDPAEIHQALINILINANDALPEGGQIAISAQNRTLHSVAHAATFFKAEPGDYVEIVVEDSGPGIDRDVANRIWEPFVTTKGAGHGAGLGLSRVAGVLRSHGGFGAVRPREGKGTQVVLCFPRAGSRSQAVAEETPLPANRGVGRILIVDDEERILELSRRILERAGFDVMVASEGREALALFARHRGEIGLVMTDLAMQGMNGFTLIWALRRSKPDLRVMVATGHGSDANIRELEQMGVRGVLLKPFSPNQLIEGVARTLAEPVECEPELFLDSAVANGA